MYSVLPHSHPTAKANRNKFITTKNKMAKAIMDSIQFGLELEMLMREYPSLRPGFQSYRIMSKNSYPNQAFCSD